MLLNIQGRFDKQQAAQPDVCCDVRLSQIIKDYKLTRDTDENNFYISISSSFWPFTFQLHICSPFTSVWGHVSPKVSLSP